MLILGLDGGGTGCRAALADADGRVLGRAEAGRANIWTDPDTALANVIAAITGALAAAHLHADTPLRAVLGLAGANVPGTAPRLASGLAVRLPNVDATVVTDAVTALRGACGPDDGILAAIGTGSVFGLQRGGAARIAGGWGMLLSDHGSGARLGRSLAEAALLAADGFAPASPLTTALLAETGGPSGLVRYAAAAQPAGFAAWVPRVTAAAAAGDPVAEALLADATAAVARAIDALLADDPVPVRFLGGLGPTYAARLADRYGTLIAPALGTALDGALALAREGGASPQPLGR